MARDRAATSRRILEAGRELFAEHGYEQVTMRMIAAAADANVSLINRYFGTKAGLFAQVVATGSTLEAVIEGDPEGLPARLAARMAARLSTGTVEQLTRTIDRAGNSPEIRAVLRARVEDAMIGAIAERLTGPRPRERAALAVTFILGVSSLRRLLGPEPLRDADQAAVEARLTAVFSACLRP
ncbi:TetR/AcrR family transcriptional regulator [Microtetraspora glauca]|uniref:TetR family transcriptional regulator n=1 Tax=Microtetraspora glauca TaxID=1996 RepID=A0ABV3GBE4_MICGL